MLHFILFVLTASVIALMRMRTLSTRNMSEPGQNVTEAQAEPVFAPANTTEAAPEAPEPVNTPKTNRKDGDREFIQVWNASSTGTMGWHSYEGDTTGLKWRNVIITWNLVDGKLKKNVSFEYPEGNKPAKKDDKTTKSEPITKHSKDELLEAIKSFNGVTIYDAGLSVKVGKQEVAIREINSTNALLADGREIKLSAVPFSKAILENIIVACSKAVKAAAEKPAAAPVAPVAEQPAAEAPAKPAPKDEAKKDTKDVQPMTDAERYLINQASAIVTVMDNRRIESVSFTDAVKTELTNPKGQKIYAEVLGFNRHNGKVFVAFNDGKKDMAFEFLKAATRFNRETLCTLLKQINAAVANRKGANANLVPMKSVVA